MILVLLCLPFRVAAIFLLLFALDGTLLLFRVGLFPFRLRLLGSLFLLRLLSGFWLGRSMLRLVVRLFRRRPLFLFLGRAGDCLVFLFLRFL